MRNDTGEYGGAFAGNPRRAKRRYPIIVHSHLGWDWVWQRPQQFISRFAQEHRVLFVEAPYLTDRISHAPHTIVRDVPGHENITIVQTYLPEEWGRNLAWVDLQRERTLRRLLAGPLGREFSEPLHWFYDPMAVRAFAGKFDEIATVYDCMDQLSQFRGAPPELVEREMELLRHADLVFAGGPKIHQAKSRHHANCHSYGCGVDIAHFARARQRRQAIPSDVARLEGPVLGYFGVVDERMDYDLIAALADADPFWNVVMVGPRTKVDEAMLPRRANLHWLGGRPYAELPDYARRFDVCMMPFALNEATEYINPTKALEYMATGKPIVSTPVEDVVAQFSNVVAIADSHDAFIAACRRALASPDTEAIDRGIAMAEQHSWEAIVEELKGHICRIFDAGSAARRNGAEQIGSAAREAF